MEEQLEQSKRRLHFCMALIGGSGKLDQSAAASWNRYPVWFYDFSGSLPVETL